MKNRRKTLPAWRIFPSTATSRYSNRAGFFIKRRGRATREEAGYCYRVFSRGDLTSLFKEAFVLLERISAVDKSRRITEHDRRLAGLGIHPRLGHLILAGKKLNWGWMVETFISQHP